MIKNIFIGLALDKVLDQLDKGLQPGLAKEIYTWLDREMESLRKYLSDYIDTHSKEQVKELFERLIFHGLHKALPKHRFPVFLFIDIESYPESNIIWDFACQKSYGLLWSDPTWSCLVENEIGFPEHKLQPSEETKALSMKSLVKSISNFLSEDLNTVIVGHNIRQHDIPVLSKYIPQITDYPILDTLELSFIINPTQKTHALAGKHRAKEDVMENLKLLQQLDNQFLEIDPELLLCFTDMARGEPGLSQYLNYVGERRKINNKKSSFSLGQLLRERKFPSNKKTDQVAAESSDNLANNLVHRIEDDSLVSCDLNYILSARDVTQLIASLTKNTRYSKPILIVVPFNYMGLIQDELEEFPDVLIINSRATIVQIETVVKVIEDCNEWVQLNPAEKLLLFAWAYSSPELRFDRMHIGVRSRAGIKQFENMARYFEPGLSYVTILESFDIQPRIVVMDYTCWFKYRPNRPTILIKAHLMEDQLRLYPTKSCYSDDLKIFYEESPELKTAQELIIRFMKRRYLGTEEDSATNMNIALHDNDLNDPLVNEINNHFLKLCGEAKAHGKPEALIKQLEQVSTIISSREPQCIDILHLYRGDTVSWSFQRINTRIDQYIPEWPNCPGVLALTECCIQVDEGRFVKQRLGLTPTSLKHDSQFKREVFVDTDPITPTPYAIRPYYLKIIRYLAEFLTMSSHGEKAHYTAANETRARFLRMVASKLGLPILLWSTYGSSGRTAQRMSSFDNSAVMVSYPRWDRHIRVPQNTTLVVIEKIPFPSFDDPLYKHMMTYEYLADDVFESFYLPLTAFRLIEEVAKHIDINGTVLLADSRLSRRLYYRAYFLRLLENPSEMSLSLKDTDQPRFLKAIDQSLIELDLKHQAEYTDLDLLPFLRLLVGAESFVGPQEQIIRRILHGENILAVMPTGSGKSACFQIPAYVFAQAEEGLTVVISPLQSLMRDQVDGLLQKGLIGVSRIDSMLSPGQRAKRISEIRSGFTWLLYIAPEQLRSRLVREALLERGVRMLVVDEAHCISQWGHTFRPDYTIIPKFIDELESYGHARPLITAFTATAPPEVSDDILAVLRLEKDSLLRLSPIRDNLSLSVIHIESVGEKEIFLEKISAIIEVLSAHPDHCGIIYASTRRTVETVSRNLKTRKLPKGWTHESIDYYHAGRDNRHQVEQRFLRSNSGDGLRLLVATNALGMGVDKSDIDFVIHFDIPGSLESYYQEVGRAARHPHRQGKCVLLYSQDDLAVQEYFNRQISQRSITQYFRRIQELSSHRGSKFVLNLATDLVISKDSIDEVEARIALHEIEKAGAIKTGFYASQKFWVCVENENKLNLSPLQQAIVSHLRSYEDYIEIDPIQMANEIIVSYPSLGFVDASQVTREILSLSAIPVGVLRRAPDYALQLQMDAISAQNLIDWRFKVVQRVFDFLKRLPGFKEGRTVSIGMERLSSLAMEIQVPPLEIHEAIQLLETLGQIDVKTRSTAYRLRSNDTLQSPEQFKADVMSLFSWLCTRVDRLGEVDFDIRDTQRFSNVTSSLLLLEQLGIITFMRVPTDGLEIEVTGDEDSLRNIDRASQNSRLTRARDRLNIMRTYAETCRDDKECKDYIRRYFNGEINLDRDNTLVDLISSLNEGQRQAVTAPAGHLLINAAAGTGKTQTIAARIIYLQTVYGIPADRILAVTFSRAGQRQIESRMDKMVRQEITSVAKVTTLTIHGLAWRILRAAAGLPECWLPSNFAVVGQREYKKDDGYVIKVNEVLFSHYDHIFKEVKDKFNKEDRLVYYSQALDVIRNGHPKLGVITTPEELNIDDEVEIQGKFGDPVMIKATNLSVVFNNYYRFLKASGQIDFAGMVTEALRILRLNQSFFERYQLDYDFIIIDEYQDTSRSQEALVRLISQGGAYLNVVGDNDQTIYTFNGSDISNIMEFSDRNHLSDGSETQIVCLEENYRSTPKILAVADGIIGRNTLRIPKNIIPASVQLDKRREEYKKTNYDVMLIEASNLASAAAWIADEISNLVNTEGIEPNEIAVLFRKDSPTYPQGTAVRRWLEAKDIPIDDIGETLKSDRRIKKLVYEISTTHSDVKLSQLINIISENHSETYSEGDLIGALALVNQYKSLGAEIGQDLVLLMDEEAAELRPGYDIPELSGVGVKLRTIHSAKGEEYRVVFVLYLANKHFPDFRVSKSDIEEERRLLYVALTRAEERLYVIGNPGSGTYDFFNEVSLQDVTNVKAPLIDFIPEAMIAEVPTEIVDWANSLNKDIKSADEQVAAADFYDDGEEDSGVFLSKLKQFQQRANRETD